MPITTTGAGKYPAAAGGGGGGTVLVDGAFLIGPSGNGVTTANTPSTQITVNANSNRALLVAGVFLGSTTTIVSGVSATWDGVAMTALGNVANTATCQIYLFGMVAPVVSSTAVVNFSWTGANQVTAAILSLHNVDQTTPFHDVTTNTGNSATSSVTVPNVVSGNVTLATHVVFNNFTPSSHGGTPTVVNIGNNNFGAQSSAAANYNTGGSGSVNLTYAAGSAVWASIGIAAKGV